jgi:hypothetical protein
MSALSLVALALALLVFIADLMAVRVWKKARRSTLRLKDELDKRDDANFLRVLSMQGTIRRLEQESAHWFAKWVKAMESNNRENNREDGTEASYTLLSHDRVKVIPPPLAVTDGSAGATDVGGPS